MFKLPPPAALFTLSLGAACRIAHVRPRRLTFQTPASRRFIFTHLLNTRCNRPHPHTMSWFTRSMLNRRASPPPQLPLTSQMDCGAIMKPSPTILSQEIAAIIAPVRSNGEIPPVPISNIRGSSPSPAAADGTGTSDSEEDEVPTKIPRPPGEAGRPSRGGYRIEEQLKWDDRKLRTVKVI